MGGEIDVVIAGRPTCDLVFTRLHGWPALGRETYADGLAVTAGAHFNTAAALARLGVRVVLVAAVGKDLWGEIVLRDVRAEGLADDWIEVVPSVPTPVSLALNLHGDRGFLTYGPAHDEAEAVYVAKALELLRSRRVAHLHGDLSSASDVLVPAAREAGATVSLDAHEAGPWLGATRIRDLVAGADVLFVNEDEALAMTGAENAGAALAALASPEGHVVLKRGPRGAASVVDGEEHEAPPLPVEVVDATGAGDCFVAGYLSGYLRGLPPGECLALANACGAAAVRKPGGFAGALTRDELAVGGR